MKILIAGYGSIGRRHMRNLLALGEKDISFLRTRLSTLPDDEVAGYQVHTDLQSALAEHPHAVIISNPTAHHLDVAIPAAEAGCHILMEKPLSHSLAGISELKAALKRGGGNLLVGFQFRFHPGLQKVSTLLKSGYVGRPLSFRVEWGEYLPAWHPWEDYRKSYSARSELGGGVVITLSHPLDYLRWFFGEPASLWAMTGRISDLEISVEDFGEIGLRFSNDVVGSLHVDYYRRPSVHRLEIVCSRGVLGWDNSDGTVRWMDGESGESQIFPPPPDFERNHLFLAEMRHFLAVARGVQEPICTIEDGIRALEMALAIYECSMDNHVLK